VAVGWLITFLRQVWYKIVKVRRSDGLLVGWLMSLCAKIYLKLSYELVCKDLPKIDKNGYVLDTWFGL
jgi:hypothetical protein